MVFVINKNNGANIYKINNFTSWSPDYSSFVDTVTDLGGTDRTAVVIKFGGGTSLLNLSYKMADETSSVVSGSADPSSVKTTPEQINYVLNTLVSSGPAQITDVYWMTMEFASSPSDSGTATSGNILSLTDSGKTWTTNQYQWYILKIVSGTGSGQYRQIISNTTHTLTVASISAATDPGDFVTAPDNTSQYQIIQGMAFPGTITRITPTMSAERPLEFDTVVQMQVGTTI